MCLTVHEKKIYKRRFSWELKRYLLIKIVLGVLTVETRDQYTNTVNTILIICISLVLNIQSLRI